MNFQDIEAFVAVAETGSVSRAAARLNLTQPATTRRIQNFEATVGEGFLFNRAVKPAVLTTLGNHVLEHCRAVLAAVVALETCATSASDPTGELRIGVAHGLGEMVLTAPLEDLRQRYPRLRLQIGSNWSSGLIEDVRSGAIDCAIGLLTEAHTIPAGLQRIGLADEQVVVVSASRSATKRDGSPWRLRDLAEADWFLNPPGCGCRAALTRAFDRQRLRMHVAAEIFGEDLQLSLLSGSNGLSLVPRRLFENSPHRAGRQILAVVDFDMPVTVALIRSNVPSRLDGPISQLATSIKEKLEHQTNRA
ncbi:LysR family transcriptional regulator [Boseaceae bacterium BT-24-1]|nr:LysR family transcriptional regulator [Boseaceae bacterium BT-24-1]